MEGKSIVDLTGKARPNWIWCSGDRPFAGGFDGRVRAWVFEGNTEELQEVLW